LKAACLAGYVLPSSRLLASQLNIGRNTVVAAYDQLVAAGFARSASRRAADWSSCARRSN
jgi:GntR family transcriptional regulator/MocR family aminotransferase